MTIKSVMNRISHAGTSHHPSEKADDSKKNDPKDTEYEICIMCGNLTGIPVSLPIDCRKNYIEGLGQLCENCQTKLDRDASSNGNLSDTEMRTLLRLCRKD